MDIANPELTKKVLLALNPNKILSEDQFEKQTSLIRKMKPFSQRYDSDKEVQTLKQSKSTIDKALEEKGVNLSKLETVKKNTSRPSFFRSRGTRKLDKLEAPKKRFMDRFRGKSKLSPNTRSNIQKELGVNAKELESFKQARRKPVVKEITDIPFDQVFPQQNVTIDSGKNPLFTRKKKKTENIGFDKVFPQKDSTVDSVTNPMVV